jgi:hypothetical protein
MKVHIVGPGEEHVGGYQKVEVKEGKVDLDIFSDNECLSILASDCLDLLDYEQLQLFVLKARQKLRINGSVVLGGTDIRLLSRFIINGSINTEDANKLLFNKRSCADLNFVRDMLSELGLKIVSTRISGVHYEIEATRESLAN